METVSHAPQVEVKKEHSWQEWYANAVKERGKETEDVGIENDD